MTRPSSESSESSESRESRESSESSETRLELTVAADWQGRPISGAAARHVALWRVDELLHCEVRAPQAHDPPPSAPPGRLWELWLHEVVEVFVAGPDERYLELEFGPHGHYLVLQLEGQRNIVGFDLFVDYQVQSDAAAWRGLARVPWALAPAPPHRVNAYAMAGSGQDRQHLAAYPLVGAAPDFHQLASFRACTIPGGR